MSNEDNLNEETPLFQGDASSKDLEENENRKQGVWEWLNNQAKTTQEESKRAEEHQRRKRLMLGVAYICAMGVCGVVLTALGSCLTDLADNVGSTSTDLGSVFISRGVGSISGALMAAKIYMTFEGNNVICVVLIILASILFYMPFITEVWMLHVQFCCLGICTALIDTGCQILTRTVHKQEAGPWLGANTVSFGVSGALVPLIDYFWSSDYVVFSVLAVFGWTNALFFYTLGPAIDPEVKKREQELIKQRKSAHSDIEGEKGCWEKFTVKGFCHLYRVELFTSCMVFFLIGGKVSTTAYIETYVEDTDIISDDYESLSLVVLWVCIALGRFVGVIDQMNNMTVDKLYRHTYIYYIGGSIGCLTVLLFLNSSVAFWVGVVFYGYFNGPCVGYCYDLLNRLTVHSEKGMSVVMFGLNVGASVVPYIVSGLWNPWGAWVMWAVNFISMLIPVFLLFGTKLVADPDRLRGIIKENNVLRSKMSDVDSDTSFDIENSSISDYEEEERTKQEIHI